MAGMHVSSEFPLGDGVCVEITCTSHAVGVDRDDAIRESLWLLIKNAKHWVELTGMTHEEFVEWMSRDATPPPGEPRSARLIQIEDE